MMMDVTIQSSGESKVQSYMYRSVGMGEMMANKYERGDKRYLYVNLNACTCDMVVQQPVSTVNQLLGAQSAVNVINVTPGKFASKNAPTTKCHVDLLLGCFERGMTEVTSPWPRVQENQLEK
ncbi:hypothetical protein BgiMline_035360 [Biomphalaria glabrata]|nr:hypothetical protein BgiMline_026218 [Biomphalaria glabrata]